jgi:hypothetical protein
MNSMKGDCMKEDAMPKRPWTVTTGYFMLWLWILSIPGIPAIYLLWEWSNGMVIGQLIEGKDAKIALEAIVVSLLLIWFPMTLILYGIGRGHNWARIIFLIVILLGAPFSLLCIIQNSGDSAFPRSLLTMFQLEIQIVAMVLLFQSSSSEWFKTMKILRERDESPSEI